MFHRVFALILKELVGLWKDPKTRFVILVPPIVQVLLFAYAATYDVTNVPLGIWNDDAGTQSAELVRRFAGSPAFHVVASFAAPAQAQAALDAKDVAAVLRVPQDFSADVLGGRTAQVQLLVDARLNSFYELKIDDALVALKLATRDEKTPSWVTYSVYFR